MAHPRSCQRLRTLVGRHGCGIQHSKNSTVVDLSAANDDQLRGQIHQGDNHEIE